MIAVVNQLLEDQTTRELEEEAELDSDEASPLDEDVGSTVLTFNAIHGEGHSPVTEVNLADDPQSKPP